MKIDYSDDKLTAKIEVEQATVLHGIERLRLKREALDFDDPTKNFYSKELYPALVASSKGVITYGKDVATWPPGFDQFLELPEVLANEWYEAVDTVNPHVFEYEKTDDEIEQDQKKAKSTLKE